MILIEKTITIMRYFFFRSIELSQQKCYGIDLQMSYESSLGTIETPWGGGGSDQVMGEDGTKSYFSKKMGAQSSVHHGQIPILFYL